MKLSLGTTPLSLAGLLAVSTTGFAADVTVDLNKTYQTIRGFGS